jgi:hypothetical protein
MKPKAADEYIKIDLGGMGAVSRCIISGRHPLETPSHLT